jgi:inward rectifier potassium channel
MVAFNFSVETFATIGYGHIVPVGTPANLLVTFESLVGILSVALATGVIFARFSRPQPRIRFSRYAVIAPYRNIAGFMFRIVNERRSELIEVDCKVTLTRLETVDGKVTRRYYPLELERDHVTFFPLAWTVVHPIDERSPLRGETPESLHREQAEFLVLLTGVDDTVSAMVHQRYSYSASQVLWGRRFRSVFVPSTDGRVRIDVGLLHDTDPAQLPTPTP